MSAAAVGTAKTTRKIRAFSARDLLREAIDGYPSARRKACQFTGLKEANGVHCEQLVEHPGASRVESPLAANPPLFPCLAE